MQGHGYFLEYIAGPTDGLATLVLAMGLLRKRIFSGESRTAHQDLRGRSGKAIMQKLLWPEPLLSGGYKIDSAAFKPQAMVARQ